LREPETHAEQDEKQGATKVQTTRGFHGFHGFRQGGAEAGNDRASSPGTLLREGKVVNKAILGRSGRLFHARDALELLETTTKVRRKRAPVAELGTSLA